MPSARMRSVSGALDVSPPRMTTADLERRTATALVYAFGVIAILVFVAQAARGRSVPGLLGALFTLAGALYLGWGFGFMVDLWMAGPSATRTWSARAWAGGRSSRASAPARPGRERSRGSAPRRSRRSSSRRRRARAQ